MHSTRTLALTMVAIAILAGGFAGALFGGGAPPAASTAAVQLTSTIGIVDFSRILNEHKGLAADQSELEQQARQSQEKLDRLLSEIKQMNDGLVVYNQGSKEHTMKKQEIERKRLEFEQQGYLLQTDLELSKAKILQEVVAEIEGTVGRYAEDKGLEVVLAAPFSITNINAKEPKDVLQWLNEADVVWNNDALDITDAILTIVNGS